MNAQKYPYNILFVEDEKSIRNNYVEYLKRYYENIFEAEDGEEAYRIYLDKKPKILLIDINMPKLNGIELLTKIRENDHTTKAIMLTAHSNVDLLLEASSLKLTKYLVKPVSRQGLKDALDLAVKELAKFDISSKKYIKLKENYEWDCERKELNCNNKSINLTNKETILFELLLSKPNKTFTYDELIYDIWSNIEYYNIESLKTIIKQTRKKLPKDTIKNIFGIGYKLEI